MLTAGYEFYRGTYHGDKITAAEWPVLSRDAAACLEELTLGRTAADLAPELLERCQMALCAVAEEYKAEREEGAGVVASESVGSWSRTYAQTASPAQKRRDAAWMWLGNTGLLYRGGESLCGRIPEQSGAEAQTKATPQKWSPAACGRTDGVNSFARPGPRRRMASRFICPSPQPFRPEITRQRAKGTGQ